MVRRILVGSQTQTLVLNGRGLARAHGTLRTEALQMKIAYHSAPGYASCTDTVVWEILSWGR